jgi:hypothetical protein
MFLQMEEVKIIVQSLMDHSFVFPLHPTTISHIASDNLEQNDTSLVSHVLSSFPT